MPARLGKTQSQSLNTGMGKAEGPLPNGSPKTIDPNAGYPSVHDAKQIQKYAPQCWNLFFGKKYILPQYRAHDYVRQDFVNFIEWSALTTLPYAEYRDDIMMASFCNTAASLHHGRPTLFLERELGEPLLRAPLPEDMMAEDIKWKWPAMRIYLPKGLITLNENHSLMFMDLGLLEENEGRSVPLSIARELNLFGRKTFPQESSNLDFQRLTFQYPDRAIVVSGILNLIDGTTPTDLTVYAMVKPFKHYTIAQIKAMTDKLKSAWVCDKADDSLSAKLEHLAFQVLLFLSAYPLEYQPETMLRKPAIKGERHISGLYGARFVGSSQIRPNRGESHHIASAHDVASGYHLAHHWRAGHWKRQVCGPRFQDRKLIWVNTYEAGENPLEQ
jgi:hypothetical protein